MNTSIVIIFLGLLIFGAHLFNSLFRFTRVPNVLLLLLVGILLGPVLGIVKSSQLGLAGPVFTTATLIIILFESGTNLKIGDLMRSIGSSFLFTLFNFIGSGLVAFLLAYMLAPSMELMGSVFFGVIVAGTSSAVVIPVIQQLKMHEKGATILLLESALSDVFCLVIGLAMLEGMSRGVFDPVHIWEKIWKSFLLATLIGFGGGVLWTSLLSRIRTIKNSIFTNLAFVFIVYGVTEMMGYNGGIATLIAGITLGNMHLLSGNILLGRLFRESKLQNEEKHFFSEMVFILSTFFFVYVGVCVHFGSIWIYVVALLIVLGIIMLRPLSVKIFVRKKISLLDLSIMSVLAPKGLVPAILAAIPLQMGIAGGQSIQDLSYAVVLLSILVCSVLVIILSKNPFSISFLRKQLIAGSTDADKVDQPINGDIGGETDVSYSESNKP